MRKIGTKMLEKWAKNPLFGHENDLGHTHRAPYTLLLHKSNG